MGADGGGVFFFSFVACVVSVVFGRLSTHLCIHLLKKSTWYSFACDVRREVRSTTYRRWNRVDALHDHEKGSSRRLFCFSSLTTNSSRLTLPSRLLSNSSIIACSSRSPRLLSPSSFATRCRFLTVIYMMYKVCTKPINRPKKHKNKDGAFVTQGAVCGVHLFSPWQKRRHRE